VFECTQPYFVLLQETLNFFVFALWGGGARPAAPPLVTPLDVVTARHRYSQLRSACWWVSVPSDRDEDGEESTERWWRGLECVCVQGWRWRAIQTAGWTQPV